MSCNPFLEQLKVCLHLLKPSPCKSLSLSTLIIVLMMTAHLTGRMGSTPILPIRRTVTIGIIVKLDGEGDGHSNGVSTCKHTLKGTYSFWKSGKIEMHFSSQEKVREFGFFYQKSGKSRGICFFSSKITIFFHQCAHKLISLNVLL